MSERVSGRFSRASARGVGRRLADVGRHADPQHGVADDGPADDVGRQDRQEREVGRRARLAVLRQSGGRPAASCSIGTNNEAMRDPKQAGDRGVLMAFREATGEFMWQATFEKLVVGPRQRLAVPGHRQLAADHRRRRLLHHQPRHDRRRRPRRASTTTRTTAPIKDEKLTGKNDPDIIWMFDMMEEVGAFPHNLANSSPVADGNLLLLQHRQRPGRKPRQHPVAEGAVDHRARHRRPASWCGKTTRSARSHPARPVVDAGGRRHRRRACRWCTRRATAGCAATRR